MRPSLRAALALAVTSVAFAPWASFADNLQDSIVSGGSPVALTVGGPGKDVNIRVVGNSSGGDADPDCNWDIGDSPLVVNLVAPTGVTASPSSLSITDCGINHTVTLTAGPGAVGGTLSAQIVSTPQGGGSYFNQVDTVITVSAPPNAAPVANNDSYTTNEDTPLTVAAPGVLGNDTDADSNPLTAALVTGPSNATSFTLNANGSFNYSPNANFNGVDSFTYRANDGTANSNVATVSITVVPVNDSPTLSAISNVTVAEDSGAQTVNLAGISAGPANESGQTLTVTATSSNTALFNNPSVLYTSPNATGSLSFTPKPNETGTSIVTVTVLDNGGTAGGGVNTVTRTFTVTVTAVNDAPIANDDSATTNEDEAVVVDVLANDSDIDGGPLSVVASSLNATNGTAEVISGGADDGKVRFTPDTNFHGTASFTYQANDGSADSNTATVTITVVSVNDAPVADDDSATTTEDNAVVVDVLDGDTDIDGDTLSVLAGSLNGTNGTATLITVGTDAGKVLFTPDANFYGAASFTYRVTDGTDNSNLATVNITVSPVNDAPEADDDSASTDEDNAVDIDVLDGDSDVDGDTLSINSVGLATNGSTSIVAGKVLYTPDANFYGSDSFTYEVCDDGASTPASGDELCDTATVNVTVNPVNDAPDADDDSDTTDEDNPVDVDVLDGDSDIDGDTLSINSAGLASNGSTAIVGGKVRYTPDANFYGSDSFTYQVCDDGASTPASGDELCDTATVNVTVNPVNDAPDADDDSDTTDEDNPVDVDVLDGDSDIDGDTLSINSAGLASNGSTAIVGGKVRYTPDANFYGTDSFTYEVCDDGASTPASGDELCDTGTVTVTVSPVNDAPEADDDSETVAEDGSVDVDVLDGDTDVDGDTLAIDSVGSASNGSTSIVAGKVRYTPDANFYGTDSFTYQVCDNDSTTGSPVEPLCDEGTVTVTVTAVNDAPMVTPGDDQVTSEGTSVTVGGSFTDVDQASGEQYEVVINWGDSSQTTQYVTSNSFSASHTYADDEAGAADDDFPVSITVTDDGTTDGSPDPKWGSANLKVHVNNVAPTVAAPTLSLNPVTGVLSMSTTFSDPAGALDAPYTGKFVVDGNDVAGTVSGSSMTGSTTLEPGCHTLTVTASVTDNDDGTGSAGASLANGDVYTASFMAPIRDDVRNIAKYGNVVPVKVQLASNCTPGTTVTTASLFLTIAQGQDALLDDSVDDSSTVVATSVSNADSGTQMRVADGKYIYNLTTKSMSVGKDYTIRVRSGSPTGPIILRALFQPKK